MWFHTYAPTLKYQQNNSNIFCLSSLASDLTVYEAFVAEGTIAGQIEESLNCQSKVYPDGIKFVTTIMLGKDQRTVD